MISTSGAYTAANSAQSKVPIHLVKLSPYPNLLVGAWALSEASGDRADYTGRNPLTPSGSPGTSAGKVGSTALQLSQASNQYLYRTNTDASCLIINNESFMITCWVYIDTTGFDRVIASQWSAASNQSWYLRYATGTNRFEFTIYDTGTTTYTATANVLGAPSTGTWYFIVAWFDRAGNTVNIRVNNNGTADTTATSTTAIQASTYDLLIGAIESSGGAPVEGYWDGRIEQLTFWRRILTSSEQNALYNSGTGADFSVVTDPTPYVYSSGRNLSRENLGNQYLEMGQLSFQSFIEQSETPLTTLTFALQDIGGAVSAVVANGLIGYKVRLYSGYYGLTLSDFVQVFGGRITEIQQSGGRYLFTCRSYLTYGQDKTIFDDAATTLQVAVNSTDTTFTVADASGFPNAQSVPQSFRRMILIDSTEIADYRGRSDNGNGTWNLTNVVRSAAIGHPFPPFFGTAVAHSQNAVVRFFPKVGQLTPETSQASSNSMHPIKQMQDVLNSPGNQGLGEFVIPLDIASWDAAQVLLGESLQFRYISADGVNGKSWLESYCKDLGAYLFEKGNGNLAIKLFTPVSTLHAAWKLEEASGTRVDVMHINRSRNYNLTAVGGPGNTTGKIGSAVQITAGSQYLWHSYNGLQPAGADFSVAVWVYLDSKSGTRTIVSQWDIGSAADQAWRIIHNNTGDRFEFVTTDGTNTATLTANTFGAPSLATWYLIIATFERTSATGGTMSLSVNGTADTTLFGYIPVPTMEEFRVGASGSGAGTGHYWDGRIDELGMWYDHVLTSAEKTWLYNSGNGRAIEDFPANFPTSSPASVDTVTDSHVIDRPQWLRNGEKLYNHVIIHYDFIPVTGRYASIFEYKDQSLIDAISKDIPLEIFSKAIRSRLYETGGGIFCWFDATERFLMSRAEAYIQRFGREAPVIGATSLYSKHLIEAGNDVTLTFDQVLDLGTGNRTLSGAAAEVSMMTQRFQQHLVDFELAKYP